LQKGKKTVINILYLANKVLILQSLGGGPTDAMGTTLEVSVTDIMPAPFYTGKIETAEGDING